MNPAVSSTEAASPSGPRAERGGWLGPLFYWEMRREGRRGSSYLPRVMYAGGLLFFMYLVMGDTEITQKRIEGLCTEVFSYYLVLQYMVILLLTPAYVTGAIIEERQQRTFPLLLTTFLTPREIVIGKMMGRLAPMLYVLLAGVPILAILQLLGGISMGWLAFHSAFALLLLLIVGMFSIHASASRKTVGGAVMETYICMVLIGFVGLPFVVAAIPVISLDSVVLVIAAVVGFYFLIAWVMMENAINTIGDRQRDQDITLSALERTDPYQSVPDLRLLVQTNSVANDTTAESEETQLEIPQRIERYLKPPPVSDWPICWRVSFVPSSDLLFVITSLFFFVPLCGVMVLIADYQKNLYDAQTYFIGCAQGLLMLVLVLTTLRAAGTLITERKQQTLIAMLMAPLSWNRVIVEYWLGSFWRYRWFAFNALLTAACGSVMNPLSLFMLIPTYFTQVAFFSMFGIVCSMVFQSAFQARIVICVFFFFSFLVFPWVKMFSGMKFVWFLDFIMYPYRSWPMSQTEGLRKEWWTWENFMTMSPWLMLVIYLMNLSAIWGMTYGLFRFSRYRLGRWLERGMG